MISDVLKQLGSGIDNLIYARSFDQANDMIEKYSFDIIISEFELEGRSGLELKLCIEEQYPDVEVVFIVISGQATNISVIEAAEESVDAYLLKPMSTQSTIRSFVNAFLVTMQPSPYILAIKGCKKYIKSAEYEDAKKIATEALELNESPSLAYYYLGHCHEKLENLDEALKCYKKGQMLTINHYKCMVGEFEILDLMSKKKEAYKKVKKLLELFPISPQRFERIMMLAIFTRNFGDVDEYYDEYAKETILSDRLLKVVSNAMFISGKHFFINEDDKRAYGYFKKAVESSRLDFSIIYKIVNLYLSEDKVEVAEEFFSFIKEIDKDLIDYKHLDFDLSLRIERDDKVIKKGRGLIDAGTNQSSVYKIVINKLINIRKLMVAEEVVDLAVKKFPDQKEEFLGLLRS